MKMAAFWLFLNFTTIFFSAFYSMLEMACVSFNKIRLHYYVSQGNKRAIWLNYLLEHPTRLFGTTLIGVNVAMFVGSECSREFHEAIGINPDWAPISQIILVVIFGELAPMFAARQYPEHVTMLGIPLLYLSAKIAAPFLYVISKLTSYGNRIMGGHEPKSSDIFLSYEELQKLFKEDEDEEQRPSETDDFNVMAANIFRLRSKNAVLIMQPLNTYPLLPSDAIIIQTRNLLKRNAANFVAIYHRNVSNIIGIALPRDLVRYPDNGRIRDHVKPPWFITQNTDCLEILKQFRHNNANVAIVLNDQGSAIGVIVLNDLLEELFSKATQAYTQSTMKMERTFPGNMLVEDFNKQFDVVLDVRGNLTLAELVENLLERFPKEGDDVILGQFVLTVKEATLRDVKRITVSTKDY